jgi:ECF sigma factor
VLILDSRRIIFANYGARGSSGPASLSADAGDLRWYVAPLSSGQEENLDPNILELDDAWRRLSVMDRRHGKLVEPILLCGLFIDLTADVLMISSSRVKGDLTAARLLFHRELDRNGAL